MIKDVKVAVRKKHLPTKVLTVDARTADALRKVARAEGIQMSTFLDRCLKAYLEKHHPDWTVVEEEP